ncbi:MAG: hypothetical protein IT556_15825 [Acetobacteraceae bacterium]|nr:hypothetical protein [Acetobacteraceae bacterium]
MITGRAGLSSFDAALAESGRVTDSLTAEMNQLGQRMGALRAETAEAYKALARMRLADAKSGEAAITALDAASDGAQKLIAARAQALEETEAALSEAREAWGDARKAKERARATLDALEEQASGALEAARARLAGDAAWQALNEAAEAALRVAMHAEQKTALAQADSAGKGKPYQDDRLFAYLWSRGYGTPAYRANPFSRLMDGFVARVARYEPARRNYAMLTDLPAKLAEHAARTREAAAAAAAKRSGFEQQAAAAAGGPQQAALDAARTAFDQADHAAETTEARLREAQAKAAAMAADEDEDGRAMSEQIETALKREDLVALRAAAARTPSPDDDALVLKIERLESERWRISQEIETRREVLDAAQKRAAEAEALRREYRNRGYGQGQLDTASQAMIGALLGQVLGGAMSRDGFFGRIEKTRRADPWARPGASPSPWGGSGGGDFRTGGSIGGGGGFKTGGGF